jgi:hypothetical protein
MAVAAVKTSSEQKKLFIAIGLGVLAIIALWWTFFGFGSSSPKRQTGTTRTPNPPPQATPRPVDRASQESAPLDPSILHEISDTTLLPAVPEPQRNIFAFYVKPSPSPTPVVVPSPSPTPTPPLTLSAMSPANVFAGTDDFTLDVTGDKFTQAVHIIVDGRELPTRFVSGQQVAAVVPASLIANTGQRTVSLRSSDGLLYSLSATLNVNAPPKPNFNYVGIIGKPRHIGDTAILQDKSNKDLLSVQRGDQVGGGRFRVSSISDREVVLVDTILKIKHPIAMTIEGDRGAFPQGRPTPRVAAEDDEPQED